MKEIESAVSVLERYGYAAEARAVRALSSSAEEIAKLQAKAAEVDQLRAQLAELTKPQT